MIELDDIATGIKYAIDTKKIINKPRPYLGMSQLGHSCSRYLWYYFRFAATTQHDAKKERIFRRGDLEEDRVISYLEGIGIKILSRQESHQDCNGHMRGHTDGLIANVPDLPQAFKFLLEIKTMNEKAFKDLVKNKLKFSKPGYWVQVHVYMYYAKVSHCLFISVNKNNEELYIQMVEYDDKVAQKAIQRGTDIINTSVPPKKLSEDPKYYECNWCDFKKQCHNMEPFHRSCRMCENSQPYLNSKWFCKTHQAVLNFDQQIRTCDKYCVLKV